jgi:uncharacterized ferredoxin-like protein
MSIINGKKLASGDGLLDVAKLSVLAALKSPRVSKLDITTNVITGDDLKPITDLLGILGQGSAFIKGDYFTMKGAIDAGTPPVAVLIGANAAVSDLGWNCGACGFPTCGEFNAYTKKHLGPGAFFAGPSCHWKLVDHGASLAYAAAAVAQYNVDNRLQASVGAVSSLLGYMEGCTICVSLTMGPPGWNVYYDRKVMKDELSDQDVTEALMRSIPSIFEGFPGDGWPKMKHSPNWNAEWKFPVITKVPEIEEAAADIGGQLQSYLADFHAKKK